MLFNITQIFSQNLCDVKQCFHKTFDKTEIGNMIIERYHSNHIYLTSTFVTYNKSDSVLINYIRFCSDTLSFTDQPGLEYSQVLYIRNFDIIKDTAHLILYTFTNNYDTIPDIIISVHLIKEKNEWGVIEYSFHDKQFLDEKLKIAKKNTPKRKNNVYMFAEGYRNASKDKSWINCECNH
jgi:hypothetical protein